LGDLNPEILADVSRQMGLGDKDQPLANGTCAALPAGRA
jgi:hypothetical protein